MSGTVVKANAGNGGEGGVKVSSLTQKRPTSGTQDLAAAAKTVCAHEG